MDGSGASFTFIIHNYTSQKDTSLYIIRAKIAGLFQILLITHRWLQCGAK
jgi:hypothetical protein